MDHIHATVSAHKVCKWLDVVDKCGKDRAYIPRNAEVENVATSATPAFKCSRRCTTGESLVHDAHVWVAK
jgi:hypothetical protein